MTLRLGSILEFNTFCIRIVWNSGRQPFFNAAQITLSIAIEGMGVARGVGGTATATPIHPGQKTRILAIMLNTCYCVIVFSLGGQGGPQPGGAIAPPIHPGQKQGSW